MALSEWTPDMETGDPLVDLQHKKLFKLISELDDAADNAAEIMRTLDYLSEYVLMHFDTEEALMERAHYPQRYIDLHVAEHRAFTATVRERILEFRIGQLTHIEQLRSMLHEWLEHHVHEHDRMLVDHVRACGGEATLPEPWASGPMPA